MCKYRRRTVKRISLGDKRIFKSRKSNHLAVVLQQTQLRIRKNIPLIGVHCHHWGTSTPILHWEMGTVRQEIMQCVLHHLAINLAQNSRREIDAVNEAIKVDMVTPSDWHSGLLNDSYVATETDTEHNDDQCTRERHWTESVEDLCGAICHRYRRSCGAN